jgi:hypothetical protein
MSFLTASFGNRIILVVGGLQVNCFKFDFGTPISPKRTLRRLDAHSSHPQALDQRIPRLHPELS